MLKKNELKNLIYIQENNQCNEQTVKGLFRSIVEPILETPTECIVLLRLEEKSKNTFDSIIKRLGFTGALVYDFSDKPISDKIKNLLKEKIWDKTEFIYVLSARYGAAFIFDYEDAQLENYASYYTMYNSKCLTDALEIISDNSTIDLREYGQNWRPDRRENELLNSSIRKLAENLNETNRDMQISEIEKEQISINEDAASKLDYISTKTSYLAHEMKNLLSIGNLYLDIIQKQEDKIKYSDGKTEKSVVNAHKCIQNSLQMCVNLLVDFRSIKNSELNSYNLKSILENAVNLSRVYSGEKDIEIKMKDIENDVNILADENKFTSVIINLIKNATESIEQEGKITLSAHIEDENVKIIVANTGKQILEDVQKNIFKEGYTTKENGNGLGLKICKKTMEEQYGDLTLSKSDDNSTDFEITVLKG